MTEDRFSDWVREQFSGVKGTLQSKGYLPAVRSAMQLIVKWRKDPFSFYFYRRFRESLGFTFRGRRYNYFYHPYNVTWGNERSVEIAIIWDIVKGRLAKEILEVGNVLSNYFQFEHDVVDKFEKAEGVVNVDIVDYRPSKRYDLIVSISTMEHVGWDDVPREPTKVIRAMEHLGGLLAPGGRAVVTLPMGLNPELDRFLREGRIKFDEMYCLKRVSVNNRWVEVGWDDIKHAGYNKPYINANGLVVGVIEGKASQVVD